MWKRELRKLFNFPLTVLNILNNNLVTPLRLKFIENFRFGANCQFNGYPFIRICKDSEIVLGNNVILNSSQNSNVAGITTPCILACMAPGAKIFVGDDTGISGASIVAQDKITIGKSVLIGAGACIWDNDFHPKFVDNYSRRRIGSISSKPIQIEDNVFIGARAIILKGVVIGEGATIGAGSVVTRSIESGAIAVGNPAKIVRKSLAD